MVAQVYIDCSPLMHSVLEDLGKPAALRVHVGDPAPAELRQLLSDAAFHQVLFAIEGLDQEVEWSGTHDYEREEKRVNATCILNLPANGSREFVVKLPSPVVNPGDRSKLGAIDYDAARRATLEFWTNWVSRGAQFHVPEQAVNDLFRAILCHALRLPRRHGGAQDGVQIDLPY